MKILLVEAFWYRDEYYKESPIKDAFTRLKHKVYRFDYRKNFNLLLNKIPVIGSQYFIAKFRRFISKLDINLINTVKEIKPDFILVIKGESISAKTIQYIRKNFDIPVAMWFVDDPHFTNVMSKHFYFAYDYYFTSSFIFAEKIKKKGFKNTEYIAFACDPKFQKKIKVSKPDQKKYNCDINFIGTCYPERWNYIRKLKDYDIKIWGKWWNLPLRLADMKNKHMNYFLSSDEWVKLFNTSKITLNVHPRIMKYGGMKSNHRTYEAGGCGSFVICDKTVGIEDLFVPDKEIVLYSNVNELRDKLDYYLKNDKEREKIGKNCQKRCYKDHTYDNRVKQILKAMKLK